MDKNYREDNDISDFHSGEVVRRKDSADPKNLSFGNTPPIINDNDFPSVFFEDNSIGKDPNNNYPQHGFEAGGYIPPVQTDNMQKKEISSEKSGKQGIIITCIICATIVLVTILILFFLFSDRKNENTVQTAAQVHTTDVAGLQTVETAVETTTQKEEPPQTDPPETEPVTQSPDTSPPVTEPSTEPTTQYWPDWEPIQPSDSTDKDYAGYARVSSYTPSHAGLNLRTVPYADSPKIALIDEDTVVYCLGQNFGEGVDYEYSYVEVTFEDGSSQTGWLLTRYLIELE